MSSQKGYHPPQSGQQVVPRLRREPAQRVLGPLRRGCWRMGVTLEEEYRAFWRDRDGTWAPGAAVAES